MEFVLIIILYTGSVLDPHSGVAITQVPGFKTKKTCETAKLQTRTRNNVDSFCLQLK